MLTLDYFRNELANIGVTMLDSELQAILRSNSKSTTENISSMQIVGTANKEFKVSFPIILDNSFSAYRSTTESNLLQAVNLQTTENYDYEGIPIVQTQDVAIDAAQGYFALLTAYDSTSSADFFAVRYSYVDYQGVIGKVTTIMAIRDPITSERRSNVELTYRSPLQTLREAVLTSQIAGEGIQEVTLTRLSHGRVYGADPETGRVLP